MSSPATTPTTPARPGEGPRLAPLKRLAKLVLGVYMRAWHGMRVHGLENLPPRGPALVLVNHASMLDVTALMVADPYPDTVVVVKASLFKVPLVKQVLQSWGAIPVERQGRDVAGVRTLLTALREGHVVALAAEGTRTRSGRLQPINPVLARIAAGSEVPLIPVGIGGTFDAFPPGATLPRHLPVTVRIGKPFQLARGVSADDAAQRIRDEIAALLPPQQRPLDGA